MYGTGGPGSWGGLGAESGAPAPPAPQPPQTPAAPRPPAQPLHHGGAEAAGGGGPGHLDARQGAQLRRLRRAGAGGCSARRLPRLPPRGLRLHRPRPGADAQPGRGPGRGPDGALRAAGQGLWRVAVPGRLPRARAGLGGHAAHLQLPRAAGPRRPRGGRLQEDPPVRRGAGGARQHEGERLHQPWHRDRAPGQHAGREARALHLLRPALPRDLAGAAPSRGRDPHLPLGLHRHHGLCALGGAAAGAGHREPVLRGGGGADGQEPRGPGLLRPLAGGGPLGHGGGAARRGAGAVLRRDRPRVPAAHPPRDPGAGAPAARPLRHRGAARDALRPPPGTTPRPEPGWIHSVSGRFCPKRQQLGQEHALRAHPVLQGPPRAAAGGAPRFLEPPQAPAARGGSGGRKEAGAAVDVYFKRTESYTGHLTVIVRFKKYRSHRNYTKVCRNRP